MKTNYYWLIACLLIGMKVNAQNVEAGSQFTGPKSQGVSKVYRDAEGNNYSAVFYSDSVDVDPGTTTKLETGYAPYHQGAVLVKQSKDGKFQWDVPLAGSGGGVVSITGIVTDANFNVYIIGYFSLTIDFDPSGGTKNLSTNGYEDIFLAKYDKDGNNVWAKSFGGANSEYPKGLYLDNSGVLVTVGTFSGTNVDFDPSAGNAYLTSANPLYDDIFVGWYSTADGSNYRIRQIGSGGAESIGDFILSGTDLIFSGVFDTDFDADPTSNVVMVSNKDKSSKNGQCFIIKFSSYGFYTNHMVLPAYGGYINAPLLAVCSGNLIYATNFKATYVDLDPGLGSKVYSALGDNDVIIGAVDYTSFAYVWGFGIGSLNYEGPWALFCRNDKVYVHILSNDPKLDFDPGAPTTYSDTGGGNSATLAIYDGYTGNFKGIKTFTGTGRRVVDACFYGNDRLTLGWDFNKKIDIDLGPKKIEFSNTEPNGDVDGLMTIYNFYAPEPDTAAKAMKFTNITDTSVHISFTKGSGFKRIVIAREGSATSFLPPDAIYYPADTAFGKNIMYGTTDHYVVYNDTGREFTLGGINTKKLYHFTVIEFNGFSSEINFDTMHILRGSFSKLGISGYSVAQAAIVYPNPAKGFIQLRLGNCNATEMQIRDITGKIVLEKSIKNNSEVIQLNGIATGMYFVELKNKNMLLKTEKLIIE